MGADFYLPQLNRSTSDRQTQTITWLTWVMVALTAILVLLAVILLFKK